MQCGHLSSHCSDNIFVNHWGYCILFAFISFGKTIVTSCLLIISTTLFMHAVATTLKKHLDSFVQSQSGKLKKKTFDNLMLLVINEAATGTDSQ